MKTINPYESAKYVSPIYCGAQAPFFICHSTEELNSLLPDEKPTIIHNVMEFAELIKSFGYTEPSKNYPLQDKNVWVATGEIYVPDAWTSVGTILYEMRNRKPVPTDNCYIQVLGFVGYNSMFTIATSAGLYNISVMIWDVSAASKADFKKVNADRILQLSSEGKAKKYLDSKRPRMADLRFIYYMLFSEMDIYHSARKAYGNFMSKERVDKLRDTERIKNLIIKELGVIIPDLGEAILKEYSIDEIAKDMKGIVKKTLDKEGKEFNHKDAIEAMSFILENSVKAPVTLSAPQLMPARDGSVMQIGNTQVHTFDGNLKSVQKKEVDETEEVTILDSKTKEKIENELGVPIGGYVGSDLKESFPDPAKLFPDDIDGKL